MNLLRGQEIVELKTLLIKHQQQFDELKISLAKLLERSNGQ